MKYKCDETEDCPICGGSELRLKAFVYDFAKWLSQHNFTNPDVSIHEWVELYFAYVASQKLMSDEDEKNHPRRQA